MIRLNPFKKRTEKTYAEVRPSDAQGPWTTHYASWIPRKIEGAIYEVIRESVPYVDAAFDRLVELDGTLVVRGENPAIVAEVENFLQNVRVNDLEKGYHNFDQNITAEALEQGFVIAEAVTDKKRENVEFLNVADSKDIIFKRKDGVLQIFQRGPGGERQLKPENLIYYSIHNENNNPYGIPLMRSCEFGSQIFNTINNSINKTWERFGDPSFSVIYKTKNKNKEDLNERKKQISESLLTATRAKKDGKTVDFVHAVDVNSDIDIKVIAADQSVLEVETPIRAVIEQMVAKTGLPPWMLGLHWSTTERLSDGQIAMLLAGAKTRQTDRLRIARDMCALHLQLKGIVYQKKDWWLEYETTNLFDISKQAQARFLNAQADYYYALYMSDDAEEDPAAKTKSAASCGCGTRHTKEPRALAWPELDKIEKDFASRLEQDSQTMLDKILDVLDIKDKGAKSEEELALTAEQQAAILAILAEFQKLYDPLDPNCPTVAHYTAAVAEGVLKGSALLGSSIPELVIDASSILVKSLAETGLKLVQENADTFIRQKVLPEILSGMLSGQPPASIASNLRQKFGQLNSDWNRLAVTEMTMAAETAKVEEWKQHGIKRWNGAKLQGTAALCVKS